jgi:4-amino-4-deoxy-L-arabinose transferase-like glycosyltransferase
MMQMTETEHVDGPEQIPGMVRQQAGWLAGVCLIVLLVGYAVFLGYFYAPAISHPDANGYWAQGTLIAETGKATFRPQSPAQYIGMHWLATDSGLYVSRYPPGLPLAIALIARQFGAEASVLLNPILAVVTLLGVFLLTRSVVGSGWAVLASLTLALNPVFNSHALSSISHMAAAALLVWGLYVLVLWSRHGRLLEAFGAGLLLGCIPTVRYPEALFALGVAVFLLWHWRARQRMWLHCLVAVGGALLPITPLLIRNQLTFGRFWRTAYAITHEQTGFDWNYFQQHWLQYIQGVVGEGMGVLLPLAVLGMALMITIPRSRLGDNEDASRSRLIRPFGVLTVLLIVPTMLLYMAYYWGGMGGGAESMQFLMPLFPVFSVAAIWALWLLTHQLERVPRLAAVCAIFFVYALWGISTSVQECRELKYQHQILARATAALRAHVPMGSVIVANQSILQHLDFIRAWRLADLTQTSRGGMQAPFQAVDDDTPRPMQANEPQARTARYEGLSGQPLERAIAEDIHKWSRDGSIWFVGSEAELQNMAGSYFNQRNFEIIARVDLPDPPQQLSMARMGGMPGMRRMSNIGDTRRRGDMPRMPDMGGPQGMNRMQPMGGPPGMGRGRPPMGGPPGMAGGMGAGSLQGEKQVVIAKWTAIERTSRLDTSDASPTIR